MAKLDRDTLRLLREATGAGLLDAKKALEEAGGDFDKAVQILKKLGLAKAEKKISRTTKEGLVFTASGDRWGAMVEVGCETDFVARTDQFKDFGNKVLKAVVALKSNDVSQVMTDELVEEMKLLISKVGENIQVKRCAYYETEDGMVYIYVHPGSRLAAMVEIYPPDEEVAKETAIQVAAMAPVAISEEDFPKDILDREREAYEEQFRRQGKPEHIIPRIVEGKIKAFLREKTLMYQPYTGDNDITFGQWLKSKGDYEVRRFIRFKVGEE